jgi:penicillin-binding protein 2
VAVSAIANGGTIYKPHFVNKVTDAAGKVTAETKPEVVRSGFISPQNIALVRRGMWMAVNDSIGTACCRMKDEVPVQVAGKTGTAETVVHDQGPDAKEQSRPHAWFEAFAPYDDPQIATVILVEHSGEGAEYSVPATREVLSWYFTQGAGAKH